MERCYHLQSGKRVEQVCTCGLTPSQRLPLLSGFVRAGWAVAPTRRWQSRWSPGLGAPLARPQAVQLRALAEGWQEPPLPGTRRVAGVRLPPVPEDRFTGLLVRRALSPTFSRPRLCTSHRGHARLHQGAIWHQAAVRCSSRRPADGQRSGVTAGLCLRSADARVAAVEGHH